MKGKPVARFCWECGNKLWGKHFTTKVLCGENKVLHTSCAKRIDDLLLYKKPPLSA